jgi:hypothetical protein
MRVAKNMKQANIKRIRSRFASIRFEANKFLKRIRRTLGGRLAVRMDITINTRMDIRKCTDGIALGRTDARKYARMDMRIGIWMAMKMDTMRMDTRIYKTMELPEWTRG